VKIFHVFLRVRNALCGKQVQFVSIKLGDNKVTTGLQRSQLVMLVIFFIHVIKTRYFVVFLKATVDKMCALILCT